MIVMVLVLALTGCSEAKNEAKEYFIDQPLSTCEKKLIKQGATFLKNEEDSNRTWFLITKEKCLEDREYRITQYWGSECDLSWDAVFIPEKGQKLNLQEEYIFVPLSTYEFCTIEQHGKTIVLHFREDYKPCD
jgi:hypothetical protein